MLTIFIGDIPSRIQTLRAERVKGLGIQRLPPLYSILFHTCIYVYTLILALAFTASGAPSDALNVYDDGDDDYY